LRLCVGLMQPILRHQDPGRGGVISIDALRAARHQVRPR
jgi:hypothetical protein